MHLKEEINENVQFMSSLNEIKRLKRVCSALFSQPTGADDLNMKSAKSQRHAREPKAISACFVLKSHVAVTTTLFCL